MAVTVAELDVIRERLQRALDAVDDMTRNLVAGRAEAAPDAYALVGDDVVAGSDLADALDCCDHFDPVEVQGWAVVRRFWAVRVPVADAGGDMEGTEIMQFETEAETKAFVTSAEASA